MPNVFPPTAAPRPLRPGDVIRVGHGFPLRRLRPGPAWLWLRWTRGSLPILEALGGQLHAPLLRRMKAWSFHGLSRLGLMPAAPGFIDRGLLVDHIGQTVTLGYGRDERDIRLDRILLHKNQSLHLVGVDRTKSRAAGELRSFRLDRVWALEIPPLGEVDPDGL